MVAHSDNVILIFINILKSLRITSKSSFFELTTVILSRYIDRSFNHHNDTDFVSRLLFGKHPSLSRYEWEILAPLRRKRDKILPIYLSEIGKHFNQSEIDSGQGTLVSGYVPNSNEPSSSSKSMDCSPIPETVESTESMHTRVSQKNTMVKKKKNGKHSARSLNIRSDKSVVNLNPKGPNYATSDNSKVESENSKSTRLKLHQVTGNVSPGSEPLNVVSVTSVAPSNELKRAALKPLSSADTDADCDESMTRRQRKRIRPNKNSVIIETIERNESISNQKLDKFSAALLAIQNKLEGQTEVKRRNKELEKKITDLNNTLAQIRQKDRLLQTSEKGVSRDGMVRIAQGPYGQVYANCSMKDVIASYVKDQGAVANSKTRRGQKAKK